MKKTILALILALLMVMPLLVSCGDEGGSGTETNEVTETKKVDPVTAEIDGYVADIAENVDFSGETFTYLMRQLEDVTIEEEETGSLLSNAMYYRQREIEEIFGVDWEYVIAENSEEVSEKVITDFMASMGAYDLASGTIRNAGQPMMFSGALINIDDFSFVDTTREWWVSTLYETMSINGKLYFLTGTIVPEHYYDAGCVMFHKGVADDYNIPDLYSIVNDGEWTVDKMFEVAQAIPTNSTGSGAYRFCMTGYRATGIDLMFANGMQITYFDEEGVPYIAENLSAELADFAGKISDVLGDDTIVCTSRPKGIGGEDVTEKYGVQTMDDMFINGRALFFLDCTSKITSLRDKEVEFGILPIPKGDASMEYRTYAESVNGAAVYVPKMVKDVEKVDAIVEAMAALSQKHVKPAFYEKMLKSRSTYDSESMEMIDIIFSTKSYDLIDIYGGGDLNQSGGYVSLIDRAIKDDDSSLASSYRSNRTVVAAKLRTMLNTISFDE